MTKFLLLVASSSACLASASLVQAQAPSDLNEQLIWNAYQKLESDTAYELDLTGTTTINSTTSATNTRNFKSSLFFSLSTDPRTNLQSLAKVELDNYTYNNTTRVWALTRRAVGDGAHLWIYDLTRNQYYSTFYSSYGKVGPANGNTSDTPVMLQQLDVAVEGPSAYLVRILREVNQGIAAPGTSYYQSWAPGEVTVQPPTIPPTIDPLVPSRTYSTTPTEQWVLYGPTPTNNPKYYRVPPDRSVAFQIDNKSGDANSPDWRLTAIYFAERTKTTFTDWNIQVTDPTLTLPTGTFQPYDPSTLQGWKPLNVTQHYTG